MRLLLHLLLLLPLHLLLLLILLLLLLLLLLLQLLLLLLLVYSCCLTHLYTCTRAPLPPSCHSAADCSATAAFLFARAPHLYRKK